MTEASSFGAGFGVPRAAPGKKRQKTEPSLERSGGWSPEELRQLMRFFTEGKDNAEIGRLMGRTATAISVKASRIGLKRLPKDSDITYSMIPCLGCREIFPSSGSGNRYCDCCKSSDNWRTGSSFSLG